MVYNIAMTVEGQIPKSSWMARLYILNRQKSEAILSRGKLASLGFEEFGAREAFQIAELVDQQFLIDSAFFSTREQNKDYQILLEKFDRITG